jgi:periplasmic protein TonB
MKTDAILKADVLDIIFENRNKSYGAYTLRKFYNNRLYKALGAMFGFVILLSSFTLFKGKAKITGGVIIDSGFVVKQVSIDNKKPEPPKIQIPPVSATPQKAVSSVQFTNNIKITKDPVTTTIKDIGDDVAIDNRDFDAPSGGEGPKVIPFNVGGGGGGKDTGAIAVPVKPIDKITPNNFAEVMPTYPGGMEALRNFLQKNLQNPEDIEEGQTVSVKIKFVVGYDGTLKSFETVEDGGSAFNNEVIRVLKKMKPWNPGKTRGENVSVYYTIPVKFITSQ